MRLSPSVSGQKSVRLGLAALVLAAAVASSYLPAVRGGFVWDDDSYVTENRTLRSAGGLKEIWLSPGSTPQYYPLVFTSFWAEYRLWRLRPLGYHLVNVVLHIANTLFVWWLFRSLAVPGAWLAAAIWGLHPVNVESVAWITERKNVLSGFFYLASLLAFVRARPPYPVAAGLFGCALLSTSVTATLPLALVLIWWWKGTDIGFRKMFSLLPLLAAGAAFAGMTLWMERFHVGAQGEDWALTLSDRLLIAGRAVWFYAGKLLWPADLSFIYPRWDVRGAPWSQCLYPLAAVGVVAALWFLRAKVGRGPLAAVLYFIGTLAPALGFVDIYPMRFSFVADHFTYLASIGLVALFAAVLDRALSGAISRLSRGATEDRKQTHRILRGAVAAFILLLPLGILTWRQGGIYRDLETLWRDTTEKNPAAWIAHNNLAVILADRGRTGEAIRHYGEALNVRPELADARVNLGNALLAEGRTEEAVTTYRRALQFDGRLPHGHLGLGVALERSGKVEEARAHYEEALRLDPDFEDARYRLALTSAGLRDWRNAEWQLDEVLRLNPAHAKARVRLADVLVAQGRDAEAENHYREALLVGPEVPEAHNGLGILLAGRGDLKEAEASFSRAIALKPDFAEAHYNLCRLLHLEGRTAEAAEHCRRASASGPEARRNLQGVGGSGQR
jgi:Flp pilus assembly protein TadD